MHAHTRSNVRAADDERVGAGAMCQTFLSPAPSRRSSEPTRSAVREGRAISAQLHTGSSSSSAEAKGGFRVNFLCSSVVSNSLPRCSLGQLHILPILHLSALQSSGFLTCPKKGDLTISHSEQDPHDPAATGPPRPRSHSLRDRSTVLRLPVRGDGCGASLRSGRVCDQRIFHTHF